MSRGTPLAICRIAKVQWAVELLRSHFLGAVGSGTAAMDCRTPVGQWAVELLRYTGASSSVLGVFLWKPHSSPTLQLLMNFAANTAAFVKVAILA